MQFLWTSSKWTNILLHSAAESTKAEGFTKAKNVYFTIFILEPERPNLLQYIFSLGGEKRLVWIVVVVVEAKF